MCTHVHTGVYIKFVMTAYTWYFKFNFLVTHTFTSFIKAIFKFYLSHKDGMQIHTCPINLRYNLPQKFNSGLKILDGNYSTILHLACFLFSKHVKCMMILHFNTRHPSSLHFTSQSVSLPVCEPDLYLSPHSFVFLLTF